MLPGGGGPGSGGNGGSIGSGGNGGRIGSLATDAWLNMSGHDGGPGANGKGGKRESKGSGDNHVGLLEAEAWPLSVVVSRGKGGIWGGDSAVRGGSGGITKTSFGASRTRPTCCDDLSRLASGRTIEAGEGAFDSECATKGECASYVSLGRSLAYARWLPSSACHASTLWEPLR